MKQNNIILKDRVDVLMKRITALGETNKIQMTRVASLEREKNTSWGTTERGVASSTAGVSEGVSSSRQSSPAAAGTGTPGATTSPGPSEATGVIPRSTSATRGSSSTSGRKSSNSTSPVANRSGMSSSNDTSTTSGQMEDALPFPRYVRSINL